MRKHWFICGRAMWFGSSVPTGRDELLSNESDHADASAIATAAGRLLVEIRDGDSDGVAGSLEEADIRSNDYILGELTRLHPDDAILSEETEDDPARIGSRRVWIVDPLDGTREFGEVGRADWAVHVALAIDGVPTAGAVALPARDLTLVTGNPPQLRPHHGAPPRMLVSRTRPPSFVGPLAECLGATVITMGSAGAKAMAVVMGEGEIFVHSGGQYEWDSAAPVAVATAAGLHASRVDGGPLHYNNADPWLPDLLICIPELASKTLEILRELRSREVDDDPAPRATR